MRGRHVRAKRGVAEPVVWREEIAELHHIHAGDSVRLADRPGSWGDAVRYVVGAGLEPVTHVSGKSGLAVRPATGGEALVALPEDLFHVDGCDRCRRSWGMARAGLPRGSGVLHWVNDGHLVRRSGR